MCGIVGYSGKRDVQKVVFEALKRLEYRGYDSVGVATAYQGKLYVKKDVGKIDDVDKLLDLDDLPGKVGLGH
jgi:glucosamine--fructose-6-phosphate aminotransferase (isomerizing)